MTTTYGQSNTLFYKDLAALLTGQLFRQMTLPMNGLRQLWNGR